MVKPKKNKKAKRNQKGLDKLKRTVNQLRDEYEEKYPFAVDYEAVQTPEGLPTFTDFVLGKEASKAYTEADPLWEYQKTVDLPFGLQMQRWRGAQTSPDGKNYRLPYFTKLKPVATGHPPASGTKFGSGVSSDGKFTTGIPYALGSPGYSGYKDGHRKYMEQRTLGDKIKGIPGSVVPPLNYLTGQGASVGGHKFLPALSLAGWGETLAYGAKPDAKFLPLVARGYANQHFMTLTPSKLVVPTAGIRVNPFNKESRLLEKQSRKEQEKLDKKLEKGVVAYNRQLDKEKADFERQAALYEKLYGFRPSIPEMTAGFRAAGYKPGAGRKTQYRNPIFLKNGGKVKVKKR